MTVKAIDHINISGPSELIERCLCFYMKILGLQQGFRPPFSSQGYWLYADGRPIVHLTVRERAVSESHSAPIDHVALACDGLDGTVQHLQVSGTPYRMTKVPSSGAVQLFLHDAAGNELELNFRGE